MASFIERHPRFHNWSIVAYVVMLALLLPVTVFLARQESELRSRASSNFTPTAGRPFADNSAWNQPIGSNVQIDPNSAAIVANLSSGKQGASLYDFGTPIFFADASTPKYSINCTEDWGTCGLESEQVPIPPDAQQAPGSDAQMVIVDLSGRKSYEFWVYKNDKATANWGAILPLDGDGRGTAGNSAIGAGTSRLAGIIRTYEIEQGVIDHALVFSTKFCQGPTNSSNFRFPATKTDGKYDGAGAIPEGARVQLDPNIDVGSIAGISKGEKAVAIALQKYGAYAVDCGGAEMAIQFENPISKNDPYPAAGLTNDYFEFDKIPWDKMRVLKEWNSYTGGTTNPGPSGTANPSPSVPVGVKVPPYSGVGTCPPNNFCPSPELIPRVSGPINPSGGQVKPSGGITNPNPVVPKPCATGASIATERKSKHNEHNGGLSGFMEALLRFFIELINLIIRLLGGGQINLPNPNPGPVPSTAPQPCIPVNEPSVTQPNTQPSVVQPSTVMPSTILPSAIVPSQIAQPAGAIILGAAIEPNQLDNSAFTNALKTYKFTSLTPENAMKFSSIEPSQGQFNWAGADKIVTFAQSNGMLVRGHTLVWFDSRGNPGWVNNLSNAAAEAALKNHVQTVVGRYKGKIAQWDVVNEPFNDNGTQRSSDNVWYQKIGPTYIEKSFQWAREADPNAKLFINEFSAESSDKPGKADAVYNLVKDFKARGIPIDGVGFQTHADMNYPGSGPAIEANMKRLASLGVKVEITELDVRAPDETQRATRYAAIGTACKNAGNCTGITTWGLYDGHTWLSGKNPLLLDNNFKPKPAYNSLMQSISR